MHCDMEQREGSDMAQVAKEQLLRNCSTVTGGFGTCVYPSGSQSSPSAKKSYHVVELQSVNDTSNPVSACCNAVLDKIRQSIETVFSPARSARFNTSFWGDFAQTLKL